MGEKEVKKVAPEDLTTEERAYYHETWGFDPVVDKIVPDPKVPSSSLENPHVYYYESKFPLEQDPKLARAGVVLFARLNVYSSRHSWSKLIFTRDLALRREVSFAAEGVDNIELPINASPDAPPWERFIALISFTRELVKDGLLNGISCLDPPFYIELVRTLYRVAAVQFFPLFEAHFYQMLFQKPPEWITDRWGLDDDGTFELDEIFSLKEGVFNNPSYLKSFDGAARAKLVDVLIILYYEEWERTEDYPHEWEGGIEVITDYSPRILLLTLTASFIAALDPVKIFRILEVVHQYIWAGRSSEELKPIAHLLEERHRVSYPKRKNQ